MRKKHVKTLSALFLALCMIAQPCLSYAAETSVQQPQTVEQETPEEQPVVPPAVETPVAEAPAVETPIAETPVAEAPVPEETAPVPEETVTELSVELTESLADYLQKQEDTASYADTVSLKVKTSGGYLLTREDLDVMAQMFPALTRLDVRQSMFDSEETLMAFQEYFASIGTVEFLYTEGTFPAEEIPKEEVDPDAGEESFSDIELQDTDYTLQLNGICLLDKGIKYEVGVAYESTDPNIEFQWKQYDLSRGIWTMISDWSNGNWTSWKPEKSGDYWLYVEAKTSDGKVKTQVCGHHISGAKIKSFSVSPQSPGWTDSTIMLKGSYQDLINEVGLSRFIVYDGSVWKEISRNENSAEWMPGKLGSYLLCYEIYNKDGKLIAQSFTGYSIEQPYMNILGIYVRKDGTMNYSMAASVSTNDKNAQYRWKYYDPGAGEWHDISGWSNSNATNWNAPKEGYYWLYVETKIHDGSTQNYTIGYTVNRYPADLESMMYLANVYSSYTPYIIMVNSNTHKVGVFQGWAGNWTPVYYWDCTTGAPSTPTVKGTFRVGSKGYYFDSGSARCYWYTQFYGNYLFHSVLYSKYNGALMDGRLGMSLSHGCVRLDINNAYWIYANIPSGTTVVVY